MLPHRTRRFPALLVTGSILALLIALPGFQARIPHAALCAEKEGERIPLNFKSVVGYWLLTYPGNYGYRFNLHSNYRATVSIYLNNQTLFFNGVYTITDTDKLRINIYEMKVEHRSAPGRNRGYVKAKSSHFTFGGYKIVKNGTETLHLRPIAIIIDGMNSEGYFEPLIKLSRVR